MNDSGSMTIGQISIIKNGIKIIIIGSVIYIISLIIIDSFPIVIAPELLKNFQCTFYTIQYA